MMTGAWIFVFCHRVAAIRTNPSNFIDKADNAMVDHGFVGMLPPTVSPKFHVVYKPVYVEYMHIPVTLSMTVDNTASKYRYSSIFSQGSFVYPVSDNLLAKDSTYTHNLTFGGSCLSEEKNWSQIVDTYGFGWLQRAAFRENKSISGKACQLWELSETNKYNWSACIDGNGIPRSFSLAVAPEQGGYSFAKNLAISGAELLDERSPVTGDFSASKECAQWPGEICEGDGVVRLKAFRSTSYVSPTLAGQDASDLLAAGSSACSYVADKIVMYDVNATPSYGPYGFCNYVKNYNLSSCYGSYGKHVGRTAAKHALASLPFGGRCNVTALASTGIWWSWPEAGECADGEPVGTDGCTWSSKISKVVNYDCAMGGFLLKMLCRLPLPSLEAKITKLFMENFETCPNVE